MPSVTASLAPDHHAWLKAWARDNQTTMAEMVRGLVELARNVQLASTGCSQDKTSYTDLVQAVRSQAGSEPQLALATDTLSQWIVSLLASNKLPDTIVGTKEDDNAKATFDRLLTLWAEKAGFDDPTQARLTPARRAVLKKAIRHMGEDGVAWVLHNAMSFGPWSRSSSYPALTQLFGGGSLDIVMSEYEQRGKASEQFVAERIPDPSGGYRVIVRGRDGRTVVTWEEE